MTDFNADLWWFWNEADGDMGKRAASLEPRTSGGVTDFAPDRSRMRAASRYRDIELTLGGLEEDQVQLLRLAHSPVPPSIRPQVSKLGTLAHVVFHLAPNSAWVMERIAKTNVELEELVVKAKRKVSKAIGTFQKEYEAWNKASRTKAVREKLSKVAS